MAAERIVIVGAGLAGAGAAAELRERGFDGDIDLVGAEAHPPYIRPPLSKGYLAGDDDRGSFTVHPLGWYAEHDIRFVPGSSAVALDREARLVGLAGGDALGYDRLLLATGSTPNPLPVPGGGLSGVHVLRTVDQADALHAALAGGGRRVVLVGSGWIGMEVAATARALGNEVTVLLRGDVPLASQLGAELGGDFARLHEENGVVLRRGASVREVVGSGGAVTGVLLEGGELVPAEVVVAAVGAAPAVALAASAGLEVGDGVHVDARLRSSDERIWAAGDIAAAVHPLLEAAGLPARIRSEHWANAEKGGPAAARSMLGDESPFDAIPYFYTDQFDLGMEYTGFAHLTRGAELVIRGDRDAREFIAFWVREGRVVAGMNVNVWDVADDIERLVRAGFAGRPVDPPGSPIPTSRWLSIDSVTSSSVRRIGAREFDFSRRVAVMAIVNRTPDSFHDKGATFALDRAVEAALAAVADGADWVDVGGVPFGRGPVVELAEELDRIVPLVAAIRAASDVVISVDTFSSGVADAALAAGADVVNDTSGLWDPEMAPVVAARGGHLVLTHSLTPPRTPHPSPRYDDVVQAVVEHLRSRIEAAIAAGVPFERLIVDPGHDLNKNTLHSLELTRRLGEVAELGPPVLVALSNKDFVGETLDRTQYERLEGSLAAAVVSIVNGARIVRVHDVRASVAAVRMTEAILGWREPAWLKHNM